MIPRLLALAALALRPSGAEEESAPVAGPPYPPGSARGVRLHDPRASPGYTLIAPLSSTTIQLVDLDGAVVHSWFTSFRPGSEILLDDGSLLRSCVEPGAPPMGVGGEGGRLQEITWDGRVTWNYLFATPERVQHHDLERMPDGHVLFLAWERKSAEEAAASGRHPTGLAKNGLWADFVVEVAPIRPSGAEIVWEWHAWDHLVQDLDSDATNFGDVAAHPALLDLNADLRRTATTAEEFEQMKATGYVAQGAEESEARADWLHLNSIDYDAEHDRILLSSRNLGEVWILDHSTTTSQAAGHEGGRSGRGGDLLWRWGNPKNFGAGEEGDQRFFGQHDARWIRGGCPGAGHVMVFSNGIRRPAGRRSELFELALPADLDAGSSHEAGLPFAPELPCWSYDAPDTPHFFSAFMSGADRLQNGDTLICEGPKGHVFEVTPDGEVVWDFRNPFGEPAARGGVPPHALFRATRIAPDHAGLVGKHLNPQPR